MKHTLKNIFKLHKSLILFLGFSYGATIVFPAFGPALYVAVGDKMPQMSTVAFLFYVISFIFPPSPNHSKRISPNTVFIGACLLSPFVIFLDKLATPLQWSVVLIFSLFAGQLGGGWTQFYRIATDNEERGQVAALSIGITFFTLYVCTLLIQWLPVRAALILPMFLIFLSARHLNKISRGLDPTQVPPQANYRTLGQHYIFYLLFVIIYVSGGFTYAAIFPKFESYVFISKYYNVQPLFLTVIFAGLIADRIGRKSMLYIGFGMVGLSFITFMMPASDISYFLTQTFTQIGWGFVNTYVWVVSADLSIYYKRPSIAARGVASMLAGTVIGALIANVFNTIGLTSDAYYAAATLAPLFLALIIISMVPETLRIETQRLLTSNIEGSSRNTVSNKTVLTNDERLDILTNREREIAQLIMQGYTRKEICQQLNISINTLKTHIRHIYKKLDVSSKESLTQALENN